MGKRQELLEPRRTPVQRRSRVTVDALLDAAAHVFEEHGYAAGTTNRIAERARVSVGTLYQYFPSKDALAVALLERHVLETDRRLHEWVGHMVEEQHDLQTALRDYVTGILDVHSARPRLQHILLEETALPDRVHQVLLDSERRAATTMAGLLRLYPETCRPDAQRAGYILVQAVESLTHRFAAHPQEQLVTRAAFIDEVTEMLFAYLTISQRRCQR